MFKNINRHRLYMNAFCNTLHVYTENSEQDIKQIIKKLIVYGVKAVNTKPEPEYITREAAEMDFQFAAIVKDFMATLTPSEFMDLFSIEKDYQGHRWGMKDYYYTRDYIRSLDPNKAIGEEMLHFIWEYHNWELTRFNVSIMETMSNLRKLDGQPSLAEEWAVMNGLKTYTMHIDQKGREFLFDKETGKSTRVKKARPSYLKVVR